MKQSLSAAPDRTDPSRATAGLRRNRALPSGRAREIAIAGGLDALERWLRDAMAGGLPQTAAHIQHRSAPLIRRLVDAKAGGLAAEMADAAERIAAAPASLEPEIARLWLILQAYRRQHLLPPPLRAELRRLVGWTTPRAELINNYSALITDGQWRVAARRRHQRWDGLIVFETWLLRDADAAPALLLDYAPARASRSKPHLAAPYPAPAYQGALVFLPAVTPLQAIPAGLAPNLAPCLAPCLTPCLTPWPGHHRPPPPAPQTLSAAIADWRTAMAATPWRRDAPLIAHNLTLGRLSNRAPALIGAETGAALPLSHPPGAWTALLPEGALSAFGLWDGARFLLLSAWNSGGFWRTA